MILYSILAVITMIPFNYLGVLVDKISNKSISINEIINSILYLFFITLVIFIINAIAENITFFGYSNSLYNFQRRILQKVLKQTPVFFNELSIGEIMGRLTSDVQDYIAAFYGWGLYCFNKGVLETIIIFIYMFYKIDYKFAIIINIPYIIATIIVLINKKSFNKTYEVMIDNFDQISKNTLESIKGIRIVRAHNMLDKIKEKYINNLTAYANSRFNYIMNHVYMNVFNSMAIALSYIFLIIYGYYMYSINAVTFGELISVSLIMTMMPWPYTTLNSFIVVLFEFRLGIKRVNEILEHEDVVIETKSENLLDFKDKIVFKDYNFYYGDKQALKNINLTINKGETVGIMGKVGSGKTTLIKQLLRLYNQSNGIIIDGKNIDEYEIKSLRSNIGYTPQEYFIFSNTLKENIVFYRKEYYDIDTVLELADLKKDVLQFKDGIETKVGENGISLSGGQKQRLSIARALITNPNILILDDSLSALDVNTEKNIIKNIKENRKDKTNIIVSHRISSLINADKIVILNEGSIEIIGTHNELLEKSLWYKNLYDYQEKKGDNDE